MSKAVATGMLILLNIRLLSAQYKEAYVQQYLDIAISEMHRTGIPASIKLSQAILESNYGRSELAREAHNHFGIKCGGEWRGKGYHLQDDDYNTRGELMHSCFRAFTTDEESFIAHSDFLADPNKAHRYGSLFNLSPDDYKGWAEGLKRAGYATSPDYARALIKIIEEQQLHQYDVSRRDDALVAGQHRNRRHSAQTDIYAETVGRDAYMIQFQNDIPYITARRGDNVKSVAKQTDTSPRRIIKYNEFVDNRRTQLEDGDRIYLQPLKRKYHGNAAIHIVETGETIAMIAHAYGIKSEFLRKRNNIADDCEPAPGSRLVLRGKQKQTIRCASTLANTTIASATVPSRNTPSASAVKPVATQTRNIEPRTETEQDTETTVLKASVPGLSDSFVREIMSYTVQPKDTLYQIATKYGISVAELKKLNNMTTDTIHPGQNLKVQK